MNGDTKLYDEEGVLRYVAVPVPDEASVAAMKRFTIDVPLDLHCRVKTACAQRGLKMADVLRDLLEHEFPAA
jgi:ParG